MSEEETKVQKAIREIDEKFKRILQLRIRVARTRIIFAIAGSLAIAVGYYYSLVAATAAKANLLDLSVALQSLAISLLALVFAMVAVFFNDEAIRAENRKLEELMFNRLKSNGESVVLRALIRMKMTLPKGISLVDVYIVNPELFTRRELVRRLLERQSVDL